MSQDYKLIKWIARIIKWSAGTIKWLAWTIKLVKIEKPLYESRHRSGSTKKWVLPKSKIFYRISLYIYKCNYLVVCHHIISRHDTIPRGNKPFKHVLCKKCAACPSLPPSTKISIPYLKANASMLLFYIPVFYVI